jgi:hypothetical protein
MTGPILPGEFTCSNAGGCVPESNRPEAGTSAFVDPHEGRSGRIPLQ